MNEHLTAQREQGLKPGGLCWIFLYSVLFAFLSLRKNKAMFIVVIDFWRCQWKAVKYWGTQNYETFKIILGVFVWVKTSGPGSALGPRSRAAREQSSSLVLGCGVMLCTSPPFRSVAVHNLWCQWSLWPHPEPVQRCLQELQAQSGGGSWRDSPRHSDLESTSNQHIQVRELSLIVVVYLCSEWSKLLIHTRHFLSVTFRSWATSAGVLLITEPVIFSLSHHRFSPWKGRCNFFGEREETFWGRQIFSLNGHRLGELYQELKMKHFHLSRPRGMHFPFGIHEALGSEWVFPTLHLVWKVQSCVSISYGPACINLCLASSLFWI